MSHQFTDLISLILSQPRYYAKFITGIGGVVIAFVLSSNDQKITKLEWVGISLAVGGWFADAVLS